MKMAAAEAHYETSTSAPFSVFSTGDLSGEHATHWIQVPGLLSYLGKGDVHAEIAGIDDLREEYDAAYAGRPRTDDPDTRYTPNIPVTYWTFRLMMGTGFLAVAVAALVLWATRARSGAAALRGRWWNAVLIGAPLLPLLANSFGWIFTEMGRQPWSVFGLMTTARSVSPGVGTAEVITSMVAFTVLYGALAVVEVRLFLRYAGRGAVPPHEPAAEPDRADAPLAFSY